MMTKMMKISFKIIIISNNNKINLKFRCKHITIAAAEAVDVSMAIA
jgi:hypothetical protein